MKHIFYLILFLTISGYSQSKVELLINTVVTDIAPDNYKYYYLLEESLCDKKANDSIEPFPKTKRDLLASNPNFPFELLSKVENKLINWRKYNLEKVRFINSREIANISKEVYFKISNPIFSKDEKYARISILEKRSNNETCIAYIFKYENEAWKKITEDTQYERRATFH